MFLYTKWDIVGFEDTTMAKATIQVNDPKFRIVIPQDIRSLENIDVGDYIEIDVRKIEKPKAEEQ